MRPSLIVFVDCFPYDSLHSNFLPILRHRARVRPGFGYSVNIVAELFSGKTPDDLGYFNIFGYNVENRWLRHWAPALRLLAPVRRWYVADRVAHRLLAKPAGPVANIPFEYIGYFERSGVYPFSREFGHRTLFREPWFAGERIFHSDLKKVGAPARDQVLINRAHVAIRAGESLFLSLSDLDAIGHVHGIGSPSFELRIQELNHWLGGLVDRFLSANPEGFVSVVSDHGAANPHGTVDLRVEAEFGRARPDRYIFFLDATLGRFWVPDAGLRASLEEFLVEAPHGQIVSEDDRRLYGIRSRSFGDLMWVVDEGYGISPSFLGRGLAKSLHGYHPELASQQAAFLSSEPFHRDLFLPREAYRHMRDGMQLTASATDMPE
ncbi:MAG: hypothetical protein ACRD1R_16295 [Acidobacteriota bacterium]